jgi:hypothetical protein
MRAVPVRKFTGLIQNHAFAFSSVVANLSSVLSDQCVNSRRSLAPAVLIPHPEHTLSDISYSSGLSIKDDEVLDARTRLS